MTSHITLLLDYFAINRAREKRNFIRLFIGFIIIFMALVGIGNRAQLISHWQKDGVEFIIAYLIALIFLNTLLTSIVQLVLASFLAYSLAFRRSRSLRMSVTGWIRSEDYHLHKQEFLRTA